MTGGEPPARWWGYCPFCGSAGVQERDSDRQCNNCGFRFRVTDWETPPEDV